jgi:hypothetical protein
MLSTRLHRWGPALALVVLGILAFWLYQPWHRRPFDVIDFSDFLPLLIGGDSFSDRFGALISFYGPEHGRFNPVAYAGLGLKWDVLGSDPLLWQLLRAGQLTLAAGAVYLLLRRLAAGPWGAAIGSSLIFFSFSSSQAWVRLSVAEPLGLILMLVAALLAVRVQTARFWRATAVASGVFVALAILAKEMLIAWVPVVAYLGWCLGPDGRLRRIRVQGPREAWLLASVGFATVAAAVPIVLAAIGLKATGYAAIFGQGTLSPGRIASLAQRMLVPWPVAQGAEGMVFALPALLFVLTLLCGLNGASADRGWRDHTARAWLLGLALPAMGTILYTPWPTYWALYGLPFLVGPSLLIAIAVTSAERRSRRWRWTARALATGCVLTVIAPSVHTARRFAARQEVNVALAQELPAHPTADSIVVALVIPPRAGLPGIGTALRNYALLFHPLATIPPALDAQCAEVAARFRRGLGRTLFISYGDQCGQLPVATISLRRRFRYFDLGRFRPVVDSIRADLFDPTASSIRR